VADAGAKGLSFKTIASKVLPGTGRIQRYLAKGMLQATLDYLVNENRLMCLQHRGNLIYRDC